MPTCMHTQGGMWVCKLLKVLCLRRSPNRNFPYKLCMMWVIHLPNLPNSTKLVASKYNILSWSLIGDGVPRKSYLWLGQGGILRQRHFSCELGDGWSVKTTCLVILYSLARVPVSLPEDLLNPFSFGQHTLNTLSPILTIPQRSKELASVFIPCG